MKTEVKVTKSNKSSEKVEAKSGATSKVIASAINLGKTSAAAVKKKTSDIAPKVGNKSAEVATLSLGAVALGMENLTEKSKKQYEIRKKKVLELAHTASMYLDSYKRDAKMSSFKKKKAAIVSKLGPVVYESFIVNKRDASKAFKSAEVEKLLENINSLDTKITELGSKLDSKKKA